MKRWWRDTLFRRLFVLMVVAVMGSHLVAWFVVTRFAMPDLVDERPRTVSAPADWPWPGGAPGDGPRPDAPPLAAGPRPGDPPGNGLRIRRSPPMPILGSLPPTPGLPGTASDLPLVSVPNRSLPTRVLVLDYGIRILLMGLAAWWGARWLSRPVARMVDAAREVGDAVSRGATPAPLDERRGTVEVREAAQVFNRMSERLAQEFRGRGLLMASISHDLRTPLTRMRLRLENLQPADLAQRSVGDIQEMNELIDGAIGVFRAEDAHAEALQPTDVFALVQSLSDDLAETGQQVELQGLPLVALAKPAALRRAVSNLIANALRYGGGAQVTVLADPLPTIRIDDRGPGIPDDQLQRVLEPFYRLDPSRNRDSGGAGLGLHIASSLLRGQHATLSLANRPGGGLRAEVRLRAPDSR
jgi:protein-histidine pros-kinase